MVSRNIIRRSMPSHYERNYLDDEDFEREFSDVEDFGVDVSRIQDPELPEPIASDLPMGITAEESEKRRHSQGEHGVGHTLQQSEAKNETEVATSVKSNDEGDELGPGMRPVANEIFRKDRRQPWGHWAPEDVEVDVETTSKSKQCALIVRREKIPGRASLVLHSVTIQSPLTRKVLEKVFVGYKGVSTKLKDLTFSAPFHEFFYRWKEYRRLIREEKDSETLKHLDLLDTIISAEIIPHMDHSDDLLTNGLVSFRYLWAIFEPNSEVYTKIDDYDRLFHLDKTEYAMGPSGKEEFFLSCRSVDCDGSSFSYVSTPLQIEQFDGVKQTSELEIRPSRLLPRVQDLRQRLVDRGKASEKLCGVHYKSYSGYIDMARAPFGGLGRRRHIDNGRIVIDAKLYNLSQERSRIPRTTIRGTLSDYERRLCTPILRGYCLFSRQWATFGIDNVGEIEWNNEAFKHLILPQDYKTLLLAIVDSQLTHGGKFDDVIAGKGKGIVVLLSGEPGVGKTLTAESFAEEMKRPLYQMSAGELGHSAGEVEGSLNKVLEVSTKWGAVLLIDECEVFLEKRTTVDIERNKLVSVFLRLLEYYKGVMFLTTNRPSTIDPAFMSRIHLWINYPKLDLEARRKIWGTFVRSQDDHSLYASDISDETLDQLAEEDLNGREIKNVVKTARLLSSRENVLLAKEHIDTVLRVRKASALGLR